MENILLIDDIFFEICSYLSLSKIVNLELLSKHHHSIIRKYHFLDRIIKLNKNYIYAIRHYNFKKLDLSNTDIKDEEIISSKLNNCHIARVFDTVGV